MTWEIPAAMKIIDHNKGWGSTTTTTAEILISIDCPSVLPLLILQNASNVDGLWGSYLCLNATASSKTQRHLRTCDPSYNQGVEAFVSRVTGAPSPGHFQWQWKMPWNEHELTKTWWYLNKYKQRTKLSHQEPVIKIWKATGKLWTFKWRIVWLETCCGKGTSTEVPGKI